VKHIAAPDLQVQLIGLSTLVQLIKRARHAETAQELAFIIVNETHSLLPYRQAVLWRREGKRRGQVVAISGTPVVERNAPFTLWLKQAMARLDADNGAQVRPVTARDLADSFGEDWAEWLPAHGLWLPLMGRRGQLGALLLAREEPWSEADCHLMQEVADGFAHAWAALAGGRRRALFARLRHTRAALKLALFGATIAALWLPVSLSALAPAEVVPFAPTIVRAPLEGVVDHFRVQPNEEVKAGQPLLALDPRTLDNKLEVAVQALAVAEAELRQAAQQAVFDDKSRSQLVVLRGRVEQRRTEVEYLRSLLARINVTAIRSGIALYSDPNDWIGKPVTIGERLLEIADPASAEIEIWLPVADAITLTPGAEVDFFLNVAPDAPLKAKLRQASYEATLSPGGVLGYRLKAALDGSEHPPRIGLRGTAKVYGERVTLFYYLMRRPLAATRQFFGF
jgi:hypothetical protein